MRARSSSRQRAGARHAGRIVRVSALAVYAVLVALVSVVAPASRAGQDASAREAPTTAPPSTVILISLDGTRPQDVTDETLPTLVELGRRGARAEALVPVNPTNTFPNHVSLATGVAPEVHGIVNNHFDDPRRGPFDERAVHAWLESDPIWSIAERSGVPTASFYWVGSEGPWRGGPAPRDTRRFSSRTREKTKVDQILAWLAENDPQRRPRLITCWFHGADHAAHEDGPGAPSTRDALRAQEREIARLVRALEDRGLFATTTLVFVSDHGMTGAKRRVNLGTALREHGVRAKTYGIGGFATITAGRTRRRARDLDRIVGLVRTLGLEAHRRRQAPADWQVANPRFGDVVVRAPIGTAIVTSLGRVQGFHGYAAQEPAMAALLVARGRGVRPGAALGRVSNLQVAPTVLRLLGLAVPPQMKAPPIGELLQLGGEPARAGEVEDGKARQP